MRRILVLFAVAVVTSLAAAATSAYAAAPTQEWISVDETFTWNDCGFAVEEHDVGRLHFTSWFDDSGNRVRRTVTGPEFKVTWTNPATGASITTANTFVAHRTDNADGSVTLAISGLVFAIPGHGRAYVDAGRDVIVFSNGDAELLSSVGPSADLCAALSATIG